MGTIADYLQKQQEIDSTNRQNTFGNIMSVANFGKDLWSTFNSNQQAKQQNQWNVEGKNQQAALDEAKAHADQIRADMAATNDVAAKRDLQQQLIDANMAIAKLDAATKENVARMGANKSKTDRQSQLTADITNALNTLTTLRPDWTTTDSMGRTVLDVKGYGAEIKKAVLGYFSDPEDKAWVAAQLENTLGTFGGKPVPVNPAPPGGGIDQNTRGANALGIAGFAGGPGAAGAQAVLGAAGAAAGSAIVPGALAYGGYEALKGITGGKTSVQAIEDLKKKIADLLRQTKSNPNGVRATK